MTPGKYALYKLSAHKIFRPLTDRLFKVLHFLRFAQWVEENQQLEYNDFRADGSVYKRRYNVHELIAAKLKDEPIHYLEFGVADCETLLWWISQNKHPESLFFGFDTFTGLPEDWGHYKKGTFDLQGVIPTVADKRVTLIKGLFQETLFNFLKTFPNDKKKFISLDADLYSATLFVLTTLAPWLRVGDILVFDEFSAQEHEYLAYTHFCKAFPHIGLKAFAAANNYACVAFEVISISAAP